MDINCPSVFSRRYNLAMPVKPSSSFDSKEILTAEFEYIAGTANQANEDRARVSSFYLLAVGSLLAALFSTQLLDKNADLKGTSLLFSGLFCVLSLLGSSTIMQLARLRAAWYESMLALNQIKEYTISKEKDLAKAFRWRRNTLPSLHKPRSISYYQTLEVALLSGITFGAAVFFLQKAFFVITLLTWIIAVALGALTFYLQLVLYKYSLK